MAVKRPAAFLLLFISLFAALPGHYQVQAAGTLQGDVLINLNVTLVNTAPFPKFLVLNPAYNITVYRRGNNETNLGFYIDKGMNLNYNPGIWIMPYETVVINVRVSKTESYSLPSVTCGGTDGTSIGCGVVVPPLVNSPSQLSALSMFPLVDGHIRILEYRGVVKFNVYSGDAGTFKKFFAVTVPVVFVDGRMYDFTPNYTMDYSEYVDALFEYTGTGRRSVNVENSVQMPQGMFQLTPTLLTGVSVGMPGRVLPSNESYELPLWVVTTGTGVEITYRVEWSAGGL
ncbi:hypothetical protein FH039_00870 [Thermococcus indicus]|uniref:Uncharacterized protein n=1 Tax=Thermococcus indicus TaxID=2586643 RepID=A0A4Y5SI63_9EURY|nr:hypothetical protein [Thermococcus indicus]QDA30448.1 hypothetical protein FH039_00870 [Thermococcus indicus]